MREQGEVTRAEKGNKVPPFHLNLQGGKALRKHRHCSLTSRTAQPGVGAGDQVRIIWGQMLVLPLAGYFQRFPRTLESQKQHRFQEQPSTILLSPPSPSTHTDAALLLLDLNREAAKPMVCSCSLKKKPADGQCAVFTHGETMLRRKRPR